MTHAPEATLLSASLLGAGAGLMTSVLWTFTSVAFTEAGRRLGSTVVNAVRLVLAVIFLGLTYQLLTDGGGWWPEMTASQLWLLAASGVVGLAIGDQALFTAFLDIGPRIATLIMTTAPLIAALIGWIWLGEVLTPLAWLGILITVLGVGSVVRERPVGAERDRPHRVRGLVLAFIGSACQAIGLLLSKIGMGHGLELEGANLPPQAATYVRMVFALLGVLPILALRAAGVGGGTQAAPRTGRVRTGLLFVLIGAVLGPYLGVWLSLVAADQTHIGVAQTLMSLTPVFILPFAFFVYKERVTPRAVLGAVAAVIGVGLLVLAST